MSGFLDDMARTSRERVESAKKHISAAELMARAQAMAAPATLCLSPQGFDVIAELKLRSPAQGRLGARSHDWLQRITRYASGGAVAVSVLTEPSRFDGSLDDLKSAVEVLRDGGLAPREASAAAAVGRAIPVMRKDFLVDPYQILEARLNGASGVLVIIRMLEPEQIVELLDAAAVLGLFVLLEAFDQVDLEVAHVLADARAAIADSILLGINCRDLQTLQVVPSRFEELIAAIPPRWPGVAESGVSTAADAARVARLGYRLALVGTALMSHGQPEQLLADMLSASRHSPQ